VDEYGLGRRKSHLVLDYDSCNSCTILVILVILKMRILDLVIMSRMGREKPDSNVTCMDLCRIDDLWCRVGTDSGGVVSLVDHP